MAGREWALPHPGRANILTENADIINGLCKEVGKLMHLLQGSQIWRSVAPALV